MVHDFPQLPESWQNFLKTEIDQAYYQELIRLVKDLYSSSTVFPPARQIFAAFERCQPQQLKVVLVGQDPYHGDGQAHGLCFSVNKGQRLPPSLKNIFKELCNDLPDISPPVNGDLSGWAQQGVLLLNATLTVKKGEAGSHHKLGWEQFTDAVIRTISEKCNSVVFLLWGNFAISKKDLIDADKHLVLTAAHPSPLARGAFFGCRHFSKTNEWLISRGLKPINWNPG